MGSSELPLGKRTGLEIRQASLGRSALVRDYLEGDRKLAPFYTGFPFDPVAYRRKAEAVHARLRPSDRQRLAPVFEPTTSRAASKLERVLAGEGVAVTTGQQTGLFGGPLYTLYKVLSAARLADELETVLGQPVVPIFWVASDDHDWAEVNQTLAVDGNQELLRVAVEQPGDHPPVPMSARRLGKGIVDTLAAYAEALPETEFAGPIRELLHRAYQPQATMAEAFRTLFAGVLAEVDVAIVDPAHHALKGAAGPMMLREIESTPAHADLLARQARKLEAVGYHAQVAIAPDASNVFAHDEHGRERVVRNGGGWGLRSTRRTLTSEDLRARMEGEPWSFSPNVLFRPVVESALLPTVAYVGGPGEVAYFAQIGCLFEAHGIEPPLVVPRASLTMVEPAVRRILDKFGLEPADFERPFHELLTERMRASLPESVTSPLADLEVSVREGYDRLTTGAAEIDPTLERWVQRVRNQALAQIMDAGRKVTRHQKKRSTIEAGQLRRAAYHLGPNGGAQDRTLNALPFLARYGPGLIQDLMDAIAVRIDQERPDWTGVVCDG